MRSWLLTAIVLGAAALSGMTLLLSSPFPIADDQQQQQSGNGIEEANTVKAIKFRPLSAPPCYLSMPCTFSNITFASPYRNSSEPILNGVPASPYWNCSRPGAYTTPGGGIAIASGGMLTEDEFMSCGGQSSIVASFPQVLRVERGKTLEFSMTLTHVAGTHPLDSVTVRAAGVNGQFIPAFIANQSTPEERVKALQETGHIPGALDLNSTISVTPQQVTLKPGESTKLTVRITLPADLSDKEIGETIWYSYTFTTDMKYDYGVLNIEQPYFSVEVIR